MNKNTAEDPLASSTEARKKTEGCAKITNVNMEGETG